MPWDKTDDNDSPFYLPNDKAGGSARYPNPIAQRSWAEVVPNPSSARGGESESASKKVMNPNLITACEATAEFDKNANAAAVRYARYPNPIAPASGSSESLPNPMAVRGGVQRKLSKKMKSPNPFPVGVKTDDADCLSNSLDEVAGGSAQSRNPMAHATRTRALPNPGAVCRDEVSEKAQQSGRGILERAAAHFPGVFRRTCTMCR